MKNYSKLLHDLPFSLPFFEPLKTKKKYHIGFYPSKDVARWKELSRKERKEILKKSWYIRWSYRNPETGKMERQQNIHTGINQYKTMRQRMDIIKTLKTNLKQLLNAGVTPYGGTFDLQEVMNCEQAINFAMGIKEKTMNANSFLPFKSRIKRFQEYLTKNGNIYSLITDVDRRVINGYLNHVLQRSSARTRNNTRVDIGSLFQVLEDNDIIPVNFIRRIPVLKSIPVRHKTYTGGQIKAIYEYLEKKDPQLLLYIKFISYNFLRPVEVCRLKVGDINLSDKRLTVRAKNKPVKIKIIPEILFNDLPDLSSFDGSDFLFTREGGPGPWEATESNRRDFFSKEFTKVKKHFGLGKEYGLYSFRHTFITNLYREIRKTLTPFETKSKLMLITGHSTMTALEKYLRDIDAELPEDYSDLIK